MNPFQTVEAVFFDLDDTLCAYWKAARAGLRIAFERQGPPGHSSDEMIGHWAKVFRSFSPSIKGSDWYEGYLKSGEVTRIEQMRMTLAEMGIDDLERAKALSNAYADARNRSLELFPDAMDLLKALRPRFRLGLITNGPADIQRQEIRTLGIGDYFDPILVEGELGYGKPAPQIFDLAEKLTGKSPEQIAFVGNSYKHDILPAIGAGWRTIWVRRPGDVPPSSASDFPDPIPKSSPEPEATVEHLSEISELLLRP